jgi:hypothetical protein
MSTIERDSAFPSQTLRAMDHLDVRQRGTRACAQLFMAVSRLERVGAG